MSLVERDLSCSALVKASFHTNLGLLGKNAIKIARVVSRDIESLLCPLYTVMFTTASIVYNAFIYISKPCQRPKIYS